MPSSRIDQGVVRSALSAALRAPSAHNAQPWRLSRVEDDAYLLWYAFADKLRADPDDRDGLIAVGGFYETLHLASEAVGLHATIELSLSRHEAGINVGIVTFSVLNGTPDALSAAIGKRQCNRHPFSRTPLPVGLAHDLEALDNVLLPPHHVARLVSRASVLSWRDRRFVADLEEWTRFDDAAPDGMTLDCLRLNRLDVVALRVALALRTLPSWLAWIYAQRDVRLTRASGAMAVLIAKDRSPATLFDCGRRLIRSWTLINSLGYGWQPMSVVIDQETVKDLSKLIGGRDPVAIYRVGFTPNKAAWSRRRALEAVLVPTPVDVSTRSKDVAALDPPAVLGEGSLTRFVELNDDLGRGGVLGDGSLKVPTVRFQTHDDAATERVDDRGVVSATVGHLHVDARTNRAPADIAQLEAKGAQPLGEAGVHEQSLLDVFGVDVGAHVTDRRVTAPMYEQDR